MVGRTNAGHAGGGGTAFEAYIQVVTDASASITAVNLAGDTFTGTADATGALVLTVTAPGTYTITEIDGGEETVVVADYGETYQVTVLAFNGVLIDGANQYGEFTALAYAYNNYAATVPNVDYDTSAVPNYIHISISQNRSGVYKSGIYVDLTGYDYLKFNAAFGNNIQVRLIDESDVITSIWSSSYPGDSQFHNITVSVTALTGKRKVEILVYNGAHFYVSNMHFE